MDCCRYIARSRLANSTAIPPPQYHNKSGYPRRFYEFNGNNITVTNVDFNVTPGRRSRKNGERRTTFSGDPAGRSGPLLIVRKRRGSSWTSGHSRNIIRKSKSYLETIVRIVKNRIDDFKFLNFSHVRGGFTFERDSRKVCFV